VCPYTNDGAPDVVYNFTPLMDVVVDVDLCGVVSAEAKGWGSIKNLYE
jgi:hypothetical protein